MHPPWITYPFLFMLISTCNGTQKKMNLEGKQVNNNDSENYKTEEIKERERRLIPYMTYYVAQNFPNFNPPRQNFFLPTYQAQENILHFTSIPRVPPENVEALNSPAAKEFPKSENRIQTSVHVSSPRILVGNHGQFYESKAAGVPLLRQTYKSEPQAPRSEARPQSSLESTQGGNRPLQAITVPTRQNLEAFRFIKIIPVIPRLALGDRPIMIYNPSQPQYSYAPSNFPPQISVPFRSRQQSDFQKTTGYVTKISEGSHQSYVPEISLDDFPRKTPNHSQVEKNKQLVAKENPPSIKNPSPYSADATLHFGNGHINTTVPGQSLTSANTAIHLVSHNHPGETSALPLPHQSEEIKEFQKERIYIPSPSHFQKVELQPRLRVPLEEDIKFVAGVTPVSISNDLGTPRVLKYGGNQEGKLHLYKQPTLDNLVSIIKEASNLPQNFTPSNVDSGIKTLAYILERLQKENIPETAVNSNNDSPRVEPEEINENFKFQNPKKVHSFPQPSGTSTPGRPGIDYPTYSSIPPTKFDCSTQRYKGFFGDPDTKCQVWHYCDLNGGQASFLCPNGTIFSQVALTCDWWFNVKCASTSQLYVLNERLYKYILPFSPSFPEDYSGPVVDTYLAAKFKEMEAKSKSKALKAPSSTMKMDYVTEVTTEPFEQTTFSKESE